MEPERIIAIGVNYLLVEYQEKIDAKVNRTIHLLRQALLGKHLPGIEDMIPTYRSLLIQFDPMQISSEALKEAVIESLPGDHAASQLSGRVINLPVLYGGEQGPDLEALAQWNNLAVDEVIDIHTKGSYQVYMIGFNPGYPYLGGLDPRIAMPRRDVPRTQVPAGSVAIGGEQTGVYSTNSPGGWRIIGHTPVSLFDPTSDTPVLLEPGDIIKFKAITKLEYRRICSEIEAGCYAVEIEGDVNAD